MRSITVAAYHFWIVYMWKYREHLVPWIKQLWLYSWTRVYLTRLIGRPSGFTGIARMLSPMSFPDYLVYHRIIKTFIMDAEK